MKTFYFVRHGETASNAAGLTMGQTDVPLNECGLIQAKETANWLRQYPIERIVSSDLSRAAETAARLGERLKLPVERDSRLRELSFGIFEGRRIADCEKEHPKMVARWRAGEFDFAPTGGETRRSLMTRIRSVLGDLLAAKEGHIAVFSHGGALNAIHSHIIESELEEPRAHIHRVFRFGNCSVSMAAHADGHWRFLVVNSTFHLSGESRQLLY